jgi:hypothetical protein
MKQAPFPRNPEEIVPLQNRNRSKTEKKERGVRGLLCRSDAAGYGEVFRAGRWIGMAVGEDAVGLCGEIDGWMDEWMDEWRVPDRIGMVAGVFPWCLAVLDVGILEPRCWGERGATLLS